MLRSQVTQVHSKKRGSESRNNIPMMETRRPPMANQNTRTEKWTALSSLVMMATQAERKGMARAKARPTRS